MKALKKIMSTILVLALCAAMLPAMAYADGISINKTNFPDANFRAYVKTNFDKNGNGSLNSSEIAAVKKIECYDCGISSLKGVELFTELESLECVGNNLTELDVSKNTKLTKLNCNSNKLTALDVSNNTKLTSLDCFNNKITSIDVSRNTALTDFNCGSNSLSTLNVSKNTALKYLLCGSNRLTKLDISRNTELTTLLCGYNNIGVLTIKNSPKLTEILKNGVKTEFSDTVYYAKTKVESNTQIDFDDGFLGVDKGTVIVAGDAPVIKTQPSAQTAALGKTASFRVEALGDGLKFQWFYRMSADGAWTKVSADSGKTANYTLTVKERHDGYQYRCKVSNSAGSVYSKTVKLNVVTAKATITQQPKAKTVALGEDATFTVKASGEAKSYQWYYRTSPDGAWTAVISNGTAATYTLTTKARHNGYEYRCEVKNPMGSVYSNIVKLTVVTTPKISVQPTDVTVKSGSPVSFSVKASGGSLKYQWYFWNSAEGGWQPVSDRSGKTATYTLSAAWLRHNGYHYKCVVWNAAGEIDSKTATLWVEK